MLEQQGSGSQPPGATWTRLQAPCWGRTPSGATSQPMGPPQPPHDIPAKIRGLVCWPKPQEFLRHLGSSATWGLQPQPRPFMRQRGMPGSRSLLPRNCRRSLEGSKLQLPFSCGLLPSPCSSVPIPTPCTSWSRSPCQNQGHSEPLAASSTSLCVNPDPNTGTQIWGLSSGLLNPTSRGCMPQNAPAPCISLSAPLYQQHLNRK